MSLSEVLKIEKGVITVIGGGGKTTFMYRLAEELSAKGRVIFAATTQIEKPSAYPLMLSGDTDKLREMLKKESIVCVGSPVTEARSFKGDRKVPTPETKTVKNARKLGVPDISWQELAGLCDYLIIEGDGARHMPFKAHAAHEPVIPENSDRVILLIGADCFGEKISDVCHRPEIFCSVTGADADDRLTPELAARLVKHEDLGDTVFVNKAETLVTKEAAVEFAAFISKPVITGSLMREEYRCLQ